MKPPRLLAVLLRPSSLSLFLSSVFAGLALFGASLPYLRTQSFFTTYLSGNYGFSSLLADLNVALGRAFDSSLSYNIAVLCFAALVGLAIYATAESLRHMIAEAHTTLEEVEFANQSTKQVLEKRLGLRLGLRATSAFVWLIYTILFFSALLPFCASLVAKASSHAPLWLSARYAGAFILLVVGGHVHVILMRLLVLRPRLFGGQDDIVISRGGH